MYTPLFAGNLLSFKRKWKELVAVKKDLYCYCAAHNLKSLYFDLFSNFHLSVKHSFFREISNVPLNLQNDLTFLHQLNINQIWKKKMAINCHIMQQIGLELSVICSIYIPNF